MKEPLLSQVLQMINLAFTKVKVKSLLFPSGVLSLTPFVSFTSSTSSTSVISFISDISFMSVMSVISVISFTSFTSCSFLDNDVTNYAPAGTPTTVTIDFINCETKWDTKVLMPDEYLLSDINLLIFNKSGLLEERRYFEVHGNSGSYDVELLAGAEYSFYACANVGYELECNTLEELRQARCFMAYPDDYRTGMPMSGSIINKRIDGKSIEIPLKRMMAKVSLRVDRRKLNENVRMDVRSVKAGGCPRSALLFSANSAESKSDFFPSGFVCREYETDPLNFTEKDGKSGEISLYLLENRQGDLLPGNTDETKKFFKNGDPRSTTCSYIEIKMEYLSDKFGSKPGEYLIYRLYIGESPANFDVIRNRNYNITISPQGDGLSETSWRIDADGVERLIDNVELSYSDLRFTYLGESRRLDAFVFPMSDDGISLKWTCTDENIATVDSEGNVRAVGEGDCKIICTAADKASVFAECKVRVKISPYYMRVYPGNYIHCHVGDVVEVSCDYFPPNATFDIGIEELETDRKRGIYDYKVSQDGKKVTLTTLKKGSGLLYMEAGAPIDEAELIVLVVD